MIFHPRERRGGPEYIWHYIAEETAFHCTTYTVVVHYIIFAITSGPEYIWHFIAQETAFHCTTYTVVVVEYI